MLQAINIRCIHITSTCRQGIKDTSEYYGIKHILQLRRQLRRQDTRVLKLYASVQENIEQSTRVLELYAGVQENIDTRVLKINTIVQENIDTRVLKINANVKKNIEASVLIFNAGVQVNKHASVQHKASAHHKQRPVINS